VQHSRILAIDYGQRRVGLAISDALQATAQGLPTIIYSNRKDLFNKLEAIFKQYQIRQIVLGLPQHMNGSDSQRTREVKRFARRLSERFNVEVKLWDERLTSVAAKHTMLQLGKSPSRAKEHVDQIAAILILQGYLDFLKNSKWNYSSDEEGNITKT